MEGTRKVIMIEVNDEQEERLKAFLEHWNWDFKLLYEKVLVHNEDASNIVGEFECPMYSEAKLSYGHL